MGNGILEVNNLHKAFGKLKVVDNISFEIGRGEILGFLGPNGAGKTTSISLITGMLPMDSGEVKFFGQSVEKQGGIIKNVGLCTQSLQIWPLLTCYEQLELMGKLHGMPSAAVRDRSEYLLECMKLTEKKNVMAKKLSGGMQRRLHIIMSIIHDPDIIILDEPEAGLDPQSRILVRDYILSLKDNKAVLLTTHNMDEAERLSNRVAIIDQGKLLEIDTPEELKKKISPEDTIVITFPKKVNLKSLKLSDKYKIQRGETSLTIVGADIINDISYLYDTVVEQVGKPENLQMRQSTLEDVFIQLTGRSLRE